jgi:hypothetical protein
MVGLFTYLLSLLLLFFLIYFFYIIYIITAISHVFSLLFNVLRVTLNPDDSNSIDVFWMAKGSRPKNVPPKQVRFNILIKQPGAGALSFEKALATFIDKIIGWNVSKNEPYARGGLFGIPKAWSLCVEEQGRLSLHTHSLIWLAGHDDVIYDILSKLQSKQTDRSVRPNIPVHTIDSEISIVAQQLTKRDTHCFQLFRYTRHVFSVTHVGLTWDKILTPFELNWPWTRISGTLQIFAGVYIARNQNNICKATYTNITILTSTPVQT